MYTLDAKAAQAADVSGGRITESGEYVGVIKDAWEETYDSGFKAVMINFETPNNEYANELRLPVLFPGGDTAYGLNIVNAILMCTGINQMSPAQGMVELYDRDIGSRVPKQKMVFNELKGKRIGMLLQKSEVKNKEGYLATTKKGDVFYEMNIYGVFEASSGRTSTEIAKRVAKAEQKDKRLAYLLANPIRKAKGAKVKSGGIAPLPEYQNQQQTGAPQFGDQGYNSWAQQQAAGENFNPSMDDEIPF